MRTLMLIAAVALVLAAPARADKTFTDPAGDSGAAHDVTSVVVSNDATQVVLRFPVPNPWPNFQQPPDQAWLLMIDTDENPSTGDSGDEVRVFQQGGANVEVWNGSAWVDAPPAGISVRFELSSSSAGWRVQLPRDLLGGTTGFDFGLVFAKWAGDEIVGIDRGPGRRLLAVRARAEPVRERPGRRRRRQDRCRRSRLCQHGRRCRRRRDGHATAPAPGRHARQGSPRTSGHGSRDCSATRDRRTGRDRQGRVHHPRRNNAQAGQRPDLGGGRDVQVCRAARLASDHGARHDEDRRHDADGAVLRSSRLTGATASPARSGWRASAREASGRGAAGGTAPRPELGERRPGR